ncbi:MAG TPA: TIGR02530 family flagellar biosynthesis protein, partial [Solirubrobacteraceae bacterium]
MSVAPNPALAPATSVPLRPTPSDSTRVRQPAGRAFADVLDDASKQALAPPASAGTGDVRFSKHALERAQRRGIPLDATTLGRLQDGVGRIAAKGARDSLVLVDGTAFVVSVANRTVITAVGQEQMREHVFTNIDSAVIA